jgi:hypothetical protein
MDDAVTEELDAKPFDGHRHAMSRGPAPGPPCMSDEFGVPVRGPISSRFVRRRVTIAPGTSWPYDSDEWDDALVVIEAGPVTAETLCCRQVPFSTGAVLWLAELPLVALHNHGLEDAVIVAITRR